MKKVLLSLYHYFSFFCIYGVSYYLLYVIVSKYNDRNNGNFAYRGKY